VLASTSPRLPRLYMISGCELIDAKCLYTSVNVWTAFHLQSYVNMNQYDDSLYANVSDLEDE